MLKVMNSFSAFFFFSNIVVLYAANTDSNIYKVWGSKVVVIIADRTFMLYLLG